MAFNVESVVSAAKTIGSKIDINSMIGGIDINSVTPGSLGGIASSISSKLEASGTDITSQIMSVVSTGDIESAINNLDVETKANDMINQMMGQYGIDLNNMSANNISLDNIQNFDQSQIDSMVNDMVNQSMGNLGLDLINYG